MAKLLLYGNGGYDPTKPDNNLIEEVEIPDGPEPVPETASPATIRVALRRLHGVRNSTLDATVGAVIASIEDNEQAEDAETLWLYSVSIRRDHPLVAAVAQALNLTPSQIDEVFREASRV